MSDTQEKKGLMAWIDARLPVTAAWEKHMSKYYAPKNFNFWYCFGVLSLFVLVNQLLTGIWLTMNYTPSAEGAFASVEYIMRDVDYGWILRYMHSTGASAFFIVVYLHMFRGLMYGSYQKPRELIWIFGMTIYLVLMAEGFMGYVLPWGQMSYWGANVIVSLAGAIPYVGEDLMIWIQGDYLISGATLNRFFALHVVALPIVLIGLVLLHILALHEVGSNNPDGIEIKDNKDANGIPLDGIPLHPYYSVHDLLGIVVFLFVFCFVLFFMPEMGGYFLEHANFEIANNLKTPEHIAPVWYFTPFYSMLRAVTYPLFGVDAKFWGLVVMGAAIAILFVVPWLDRSPVKSIRYKGMYSRIALLGLVVSFVILGVLGTKLATGPRTALAQICTVIYFAFFLAMPWYTRNEQTTTPPQRVTGRWISIQQLLLSVGLIVALIFIPLTVVGAEADVELEHVEMNLENKASLQSGLQTFVNYCMGCHSAQYARYQRVADDLGISEELMMENIVFNPDTSFGDLMVSAMPETAENWFGVAPPDLTLVARSRSPEWLNGYLKGFYLDESRPFGVNNRVFENVAMPNVLAGLQGDQLPCEEDHCVETIHVDGTGSLSAEEFDKVVYDLVNFLYYLGEPARLDREKIGALVLFFLAFLFVLVFMLNREYWKDIH
ncbi:cytochrome b N-terminal domain-containing protein [Gammaproteobacteria bacterium]|nr:cytochrome b N-terminal domain-containing protein [Gammaproteobacteria bacterium]